ncbi:membrane-spanning 4-domains subfamily A member 6C-like [Peromyscus eremicus]|uniref:membrane-spanning 4-domains subfamily A member 6C-like n=1 Tax=Peromyscus eremicus TaxID=42410 RepID=UPI0027DCAAAD|nr:membrane-spanning 4-domains subfamily A member 6C-like [Peromyscus eremicus]
MPQIMTNETVTVISPNGANFPQTDKPQPTEQRQDSLKKHLKTEVKVIAAIQIMCGVMVLSLGIILASVPTVPHFTPVFSVLLKSGYPFVGALFFIISGILSVITKTKSTKSLVSTRVTPRTDGDETQTLHGQAFHVEITNWKSVADMQQALIINLDHQLDLTEEHRGD